MDHQKISLQINSNNSNLRVDKALGAEESIGSRTRALFLIEQGLVLFQGKKIKPSRITKDGEVYDVYLPPPSPTTLVPKNIPLEILFEDSSVIVVNKPAGLAVHPSLGHESLSLVHGLLHHCENLSLGFNENRPGIVHRLDKDTSGVLVVAKTDQAHRFLAQQFKEKSVHRIYKAIVFGLMRPETGTAKSFLLRDPKNRKRYASTNRADLGKLAITHYRTIKRHREGISLLECRLETGRTHQIRVHLSESGCPILGDKLYGNDRRAQKTNVSGLKELLTTWPRLALHAGELGFVHPQTRLKMSFKAPWPEDAFVLLDLLGFLPNE